MKTIIKKAIKLFLFVNCYFYITIINAQAPQAFPYQSVLRNTNGTLIANQNVSLRFSILNGSETGSLVYQETQNTTTNNLGLFDLKIGQGIVTSGTFSAINWGNGSKYLKVELDANGNSNYITMGSTQLLSVPYALYSNVPGVPGPQGPAGTGLNKAKVRYQLPAGSNDLATPTANAWATRALNTIVYNDIGLTLSSNQITLPAGIYEVSAYCVFNNAHLQVGNEKIRVQNISSNTTVAISLNSSLSVGANYSSFPVLINNERFTLSTNSTVQLQYYIDSPKFCWAIFNTGQTEVYAEIIFSKLQ